MKKYITVAALLAAGTAFANAAGLIAQWNDFSDLESDLSTNNQKLNVSLGTGSSTYDADDGILSVKRGNSVGARPSVDLSGLGISWETGWTIALTVSNVNLGGSATVLADMVGGSTNAQGEEGAYGFGGGYRTGGNYAMWGVNDAGTFSTATLDTRATSLATPVTFVLTATTEKALTLYLVSGDACSVVSSVSSARYTDADPFTLLVLGGYGDHSGGAVGYDLSKLAIYKGALTEAEVKRTGGFVPEPSAFGMLAGLGALALVASRRRRR